MRPNLLLSSRLLLLVLSLCLLCPSARSEEVPGSPGWTLTKMEKAEDDNSYDTKTYYGLKPPDKRGSITVDSRMASRLQAGELSAESAYSGGGGAGGQKAAAAKEEEFVYGKNNGIVMAEPVNSTLTLEEGRKETPLPAATPRAVASSSSGSSGSLSGSSSLPPLPTASLGGDQNSAPKALAAALPAANRSGASSMPGGGGGAPPIVNPALAVVADAQAQHAAELKAALPTKSDGPPPPSAISLNQVGQGFGMSPDGKNKDKQKPISSWPNGDPSLPVGSPGGPPDCASTITNSYPAATIQRISVGIGCGTIRVDAWGAGGGFSGVDNTGESTGGKGGGGGFVHTEGTFDPLKYDVIVVVGGPGADGVLGGSSAPGGFIGGGKGGALAGGGGGGFSGVFLVDKKANPDPADMPLQPELAIAVAAGGGGGGFNIASPGGDGGNLTGGGAGSGNGKNGVPLYAGDGGAGGPIGDGHYGGGGGGGGGYYAGGGGGGATVANAFIPGGGSGGSNYFRFLNSASFSQPGHSGTAGNPGALGRRVAGNAGKVGLVQIQITGSGSSSGSGSTASSGGSGGSSGSGGQGSATQTAEQQAAAQRAAEEKAAQEAAAQQAARQAAEQASRAASEAAQEAARAATDAARASMPSGPSF